MQYMHLNVRLFSRLYFLTRPLALRTPKKINSLINSTIIVGLSRKCLCNSFLKTQYNVNAPQSSADQQWDAGLTAFTQMMCSCKKSKAATRLCKAYTVTSADLSCAVLPSQTGCLPVFELVVEADITPLASKLPVSNESGPISRPVVIVEPEWLKKIEKEEAKENGNGAPQNSPPVAKTPVTPATPVSQTPAQTPATPSTPVQNTNTPLVIPKVPKKTKVTQPTTGKSTPTTPTPVQPTPVKAGPNGPNQFVGANKKINIFNQQ